MKEEKMYIFKVSYTCGERAGEQVIRGRLGELYNVLSSFIEDNGKFMHERFGVNGSIKYHYYGIELA